MRWIALLTSALLFAVASGCRELTILDVEPGQIPAGSGGALRIQGAGFDDQVLFSLTGAGLTISLGQPEVVSEAEAAARVPVAAPAGRYDVVATRGGVEARLEDTLGIVAGRARVVFVDVGQGDATLVVAPGGETLLIDGGPASAVSAVEAALHEHAGGRLDAVVLSHFDADHLAGLVELLAGPDRVAGTGDDVRPTHTFGPTDLGDCVTDTCEKLRRLAAYPFEVARVADALPLGDVEVEVVAADGDVGGGAVPGVDDDNEHSVVVRMSFGGRSVLVTGDLTGGGLGTVDLETPLAERTGPVDVLRVSHHGSQTSTAPDALARWQPAFAVLSFGTDNAYCHPHTDVLARLASSGAQLFATGSGIVDDGARCGGRTEAPEGASFGLGDVVLDLDASGLVSLATDASGP